MFKTIPKCWLKRGWLSWLLWPISQVFLFVIYLRKVWFRCAIATIKPSYNKPVIVVGNHWVGGTGKTPIVIELAKYFRDQGYRVGIISRGYLSKRARGLSFFPATQQAIEHIIKTKSFSDEALLMAQALSDKTFTLKGDPHERYPNHLIHFGIGEQRYHLYRHLEENPFYCDVIISDDGLQHYALQRTVELAVFDERGAGNGFVFPAGGLREPISWLGSRIVLYRGKKPDFTAQHAYEVQRKITRAYPLLEWDKSPEERTYQALSTWQNQAANALAAIGNPQGFFDSLSEFGIKLTPHYLADHAKIKPKHFNQASGAYFITEKDATKCMLWASQHQALAQRIWVVPLETSLPSAFYQQVHEQIKQHLQSNVVKHLSPIA